MRARWFGLGMVAGSAVAVLSAYWLARYTIRDWGWAER